MKERISRRDWEQLSAYMDDQLSAREQAGIEARLQTDESLREALDDLRMTRIAVKALPHLRAPRNFTLTPEMAEMAGRRQRKTPRLFSTFRLASVVSSLLLVMVLLVDLLGLGRVAMMPAQEMAAPSAKILEAEEMAAPGEEVQPMVEVRAEDAAVEKEAGEALGEEGLAYEPAADSEISQAAATPFAPVRVVEIFLGVIAFAAGVAAFSSRRRGRS
ncbi:MAG: hypothetical protein ISS57_10965 [Anaerolineales bacterium]|nr:hypothetical protein [Chloroflexota bacterium]MBL7163118.1 hypothetical protein [Anaerolineales bacterium]